ncbi:LysR substrate-binding domain-containing protein [Pseudomonas aeruginosa]|uniref:LysR substrate-binding domain-containing protein n=1 Tax=Pseudomonas aeruginosa TaxID=287 RepID=UPI00190F8083|nr:LysR family transcriptional regulator [Pseudomonas aeruginosa]
MNGTEFEQITAFLAAVEHGGFTAAGQALGRDGSILSRRVTALEKRLGVRLMERTTRRLALTEAGEAFHQRMRGALQALQEIEQDTASAATGVRGTLRIALPATFGQMWVAPILPAFLAAYPDLVVETAFEDRYVDLVAESFDVAVRIGTLTDSRLVARRLAPSRRLLCASPAYLQAHGTPVRPADLAQHACLGCWR